MAAPNAIDHLIKLCSRLPGLGPRSARRVVLSLIRKRETHLQPLIQALQAVNDSIVTCTICGNLDSTNPCNICADERRDPSILCVVEELADLWAIERSHLFRGRFHVLGGVLSAIDGITPDKLNIHSLIERARDDAIQEVIIATNATVDGQTTAHYITERIHDCNVRITRLAQGIPIGAELDYLDDGTLGTALRARLPV